MNPGSKHTTRISQIPSACIWACGPVAQVRGHLRLDLQPLRAPLPQGAIVKATWGLLKRCDCALCAPCLPSFTRESEELCPSPSLCTPRTSFPFRDGFGLLDVPICVTFFKIGQLGDWSVTFCDFSWSDTILVIALGCYTSKNKNHHERQNSRLSMFFLWKHLI